MNVGKTTEVAGALLSACMFLAIVIGIGFGWVNNIIQIIDLAQTNQITAMFFVRLLGVPCAPLGVILGYF